MSQDNQTDMSQVERLCSEAARRLDGLSKQIDQIRLIAVSDRSNEEKLAHIMARIDGVVGG